MLFLFVKSSIVFRVIWKWKCNRNRDLIVSRKPIFISKSHLKYRIRLIIYFILCLRQTNTLYAKFVFRDATRLKKTSNTKITIANHMPWIKIKIADLASSTPTGVTLCAFPSHNGFFGYHLLISRFINPFSRWKRNLWNNILQKTNAVKTFYAHLCLNSSLYGLFRKTVAVSLGNRRRCISVNEHFSSSVKVFATAL